MKLENNWQQKTLENLEKEVWPMPDEDESSHLVITCNKLRKKVIGEFTTEDLRIMIGQEIGLPFLIPMALGTLKQDLFAEGDLYEGDLLKNVLSVNTRFWNDHKEYWIQLHDLIKDRREELAQLKFDTTTFDGSGDKQ